SHRPRMLPAIRVGNLDRSTHHFADAGCSARGRPQLSDPETSVTTTNFCKNLSNIAKTWLRDSRTRRGPSSVCCAGRISASSWCALRAKSPPTTAHKPVYKGSVYKTRKTGPCCVSKQRKQPGASNSNG